MVAVIEGSLDKVISDDGDSSHELDHSINEANVALITKARIIESKSWHDKISEKYTLIIASLRRDLIC